MCVQGAQPIPAGPNLMAKGKSVSVNIPGGFQYILVGKPGVMAEPSLDGAEVTIVLHKYCVKVLASLTVLSLKYPGSDPPSVRLSLA
jgi:hypothetical protein